MALTLMTDQFMCIMRDYHVYKELWEPLLNDKNPVAVLTAPMVMVDAEIVM